MLELKYYTVILLFVVATLGCSRNEKGVVLRSIDLQITVNNWAGGTGYLDQRKYETDMESYRKNSGLICFFLAPPDAPPVIMSAKYDDLKIIISRGDTIIYEGLIIDHIHANKAYMAQGETNLISITDGTKTIKIQEIFSGNGNTMKIGLGPGITITKW